LEQLVFDVQTATATAAPVLEFDDVPTYTPDPNATVTSEATPTGQGAGTPAGGTAIKADAGQADAAAGAATPEPTVPATPAQATPTVPVAEPLQGGEWDFEAGFETWTNPFGDSCAASGLAIGWTAFTTRDQFGSSCMNQTTWKDNVYLGGNAQEITFAYVGNEAGIYKTAPTAVGHRYRVKALMRREFSPAKVEVSLGIDPGGGANWQAESVEWFPWDEDFDDEWSETEVIVVALGESVTIFVKGSHPYPEPGGALRIDSISVVDLGPE
jgi:hypothetical protein